MAMTDFPPLTAPRRVTTVNEGGHFLSPSATPSGFGDSRMLLDEIDGDLYYQFLWHRFGGVYTRKLYDGDPYTGWIGENYTNPTECFPRVDGSPGARTHDTLDLIRNPETGVYTATWAADPGAINHATQVGRIYAIQRATSPAPTFLASSWTRDPNEILFQPHPSAPWEGPTTVNVGPPAEMNDGIGEQSMVYDAATRKMLLFYGTLHVESGIKRYRVGRAECPIDIFDTAPVFTRTPAASATSWVFVPQIHGPQPGDPEGWGSAHAPFQGHVARNEVDNVLHMVGLAGQPSANATTQGLSWAIGHWFSMDEGFTWTPDVNNPLVTLSDMAPFFTPETPEFTFNFFNSPNLWFDYTAGKGYIAFHSGIWIYARPSPPYLVEFVLPSSGGGGGGGGGGEQAIVPTELDIALVPAVFEMARDLGKTVTVVSKSGPYNRSTSKTELVPTTHSGIKLLMGPVLKRYLDIGLADDGETRGLFAAQGLPFVVQKGIRVVIDGETWTTVQVETIYSGQEACAYKVMLRRA